MEVAVGKCKNAIDDEALKRLTNNLEVLPVNQAVADKAAEIFTNLVQKREKIGLNDTYIAATAITYGKTLLTADVEHFTRINDLTVQDWNDL